MVRINLLSPKILADQHLIAEYNEILMLFGFVKKHPTTSSCIPQNFCLGKGHILFFTHKLLYLQKRHELLKKEMKKRGFQPTKTIQLSMYAKHLHKNWKPTAKDKAIVKERILWKLHQKPTWYTYYGNVKSISFYKKLLKKS